MIDPSISRPTVRRPSTTTATSRSTPCSRGSWRASSGASRPTARPPTWASTAPLWHHRRRRGAGGLETGSDPSLLPPHLRVRAWAWRRRRRFNAPSADEGTSARGPRTAASSPRRARRRPRPSPAARATRASSAAPRWRSRTAASSWAGTRRLMHAASSLLLNALKTLAEIPTASRLLAPKSWSPSPASSRTSAGSPRASTWRRPCIALAVSVTTTRALSWRSRKLEALARLRDAPHPIPTPGATSRPEPAGRHLTSIRASPPRACSSLSASLEAPNRCSGVCGSRRDGAVHLHHRQAQSSPRSSRSPAGPASDPGASGSRALRLSSRTCPARPAPGVASQHALEATMV